MLSTNVANQIHTVIFIRISPTPPHEQKTNICHKGNIPPKMTVNIHCKPLTTEWYLRMRMWLSQEHIHFRQIRTLGELDFCAVWCWGMMSLVAMVMLSIRSSFMRPRLDLHLFKVYGSCELGVRLVWFIKLTASFNKGEVSFRGIKLPWSRC